MILISALPRRSASAIPQGVSLLRISLQQIGRIHAALFSDDMLYLEMLSKASFWLQQKYYGVDISKLYGHSVSGYFSQVSASTSPSHSD